MASSSANSGRLVAAWTAPISAALSCLVFGVPVVVAWVTSASLAGASGSWGSTLRITGAAWLAAFDVPLRIGAVTYSLMPIGWAVVSMGILWLNGRWIASRSAIATPADVLGAAIAGAAAYAVTAALVAYVISVPGLVASVTRSAVQAGTLCLVVLAVSIARSSQVAMSAALPAEIRTTASAALSAGTRAAAMLAGAGVVLAIASLVVSGGAVLASLQRVAGDPTSAVLVTLLCVGYLPTVAMWCLAYLLGPGVNLPSALPDLPIVAGLSDIIPVVVRIPLGLAIVIGAGALAGRHLRVAATDRHQRLRVVSGAAVTAAAWIGLGAVLASGALGDARLAELGPHAIACAAVTCAGVFAGALLTSRVAPRPRERGRRRVGSVA